MPSQDLELDVRREVPARRHELIFETYERLERGKGTRDVGYAIDLARRCLDAGA